MSRVLRASLPSGLTYVPAEEDDRAWHAQRLLVAARLLSQADVEYSTSSSARRQFMESIDEVITAIRAFDAESRKSQARRECGRDIASATRAIDAMPAAIATPTTVAAGRRPTRAGGR